MKPLKKTTHHHARDHSDQLDMHEMHPQLRPGLQTFASVFPTGSFVVRDLHKRHMLFKQLSQPAVLDASISITNHTVTHAHGTSCIRMHRPDASHALPALIFIHGGGFVMGSLDTNDARCIEFIKRHGLAVLPLCYEKN